MPRRSSSAMQPRSCECFSLCGPTSLAWFHLHLPVVTSSESPWYAYLQQVYHEDDVTLPVDMRRFEMFWANLLPTAMYMCPRVHEYDAAPILPRCNASQCSGWLNGSAPTNSTERHVRSLPGVKKFVDSRSFIFTPRGPAMSRKGLDATQLAAKASGWATNPWSQFAVAQAVDARAPHANRSWVEVVRVDRYASVFRPPPAMPGCSPWQGHCQAYVGERLVQLGHHHGCERHAPRCCNDEGVGCA